MRTISGCENDGTRLISNQTLGDRRCSPVQSSLCSFCLNREDLCVEVVADCSWRNVADLNNFGVRSCGKEATQTAGAKGIKAVKVNHSQGQMGHLYTRQLQLALRRPLRLQKWRNDRVDGACVRLECGESVTA
jgi:hypothetical protein